MKHFLVPIFLIFLTSGLAQKYAVEKSTITFFSDATIEDIAAENSKGTSLFDVASGDVVFSIPIKDFEFEKSLMKEHFNEKYMETEKYPKSTFKGKVTGYDPGKSGDQSARAKGFITIHGVTKEIDVPGTVRFEPGKILMKSSFKVKLADYKVKIPKLLWQNIAEEVEVKIEFQYKPS